MKKFISLILFPVQAFALGNLFIIGGGSQSDELVSEYLNLCGLENKILIIAKASSLEEEVLAEVEARFKNLGAKNTQKYICSGSADNCIKQLESVKCLYFSGGDQKKLTSHFGASQFLSKIKSEYDKGMTIIGTSAGAAIMSEIMLTGNILDDSRGFTRIAQSHVEDASGFGFVKNFIIDQHFIKRQRQNRLLSKVLELPSLVGLGIDESTAVVFKNSLNEFSVSGEGTVIVYDARKVNQLSNDRRGNFSVSNINLSILSQGQGFKF
tara:strand:- start:524 stop:1324 length:801 start_codon:yes stop_codon:yes gene_type:complete